MWYSVGTEKDTYLLMLHTALSGSNVPLNGYHSVLLRYSDEAKIFQALEVFRILNGWK